MPSLKPLRSSSLRGSNPAQSGGDPMFKAAGKVMLRHCESSANAPVRTGFGRDNAARKEPPIYPEESGVAVALAAVPPGLQVLIARQSSGMRRLWCRLSSEDPTSISQPKEVSYAPA